MTKTLFIGIGAILIIGLFVLAYVISGKSGTMQTPNQTVGLPISGSNQVGQVTVTTPGQSQGQYASTSPAQTNTIAVATYNGGTMQVMNFIKDPTTVKDPINAGYYYLGYHEYMGVPDPTATTTPPYIIMYTSQNQFFNIALLQEPIGPVRLAAEQYLTARLGISQSQMCQLSYMVGVPDSVNSTYSSRSLGFSFCPGATVLPK